MSPVATNGQHPTQKKWANGPAAPVTTPFHQDGSIDLESLGKQVVRIAKANCGVLILGTCGESFHLSDNERTAAVKSSRKALDDAGLVDAPLMVGTGSGSAYTTIELTKAAAANGASHAIVLFPGPFVFHMGTNRVAILDFFTQVLDNSPIPVFIYSFPGPSGIDISSDELNILAKHPKCCGVKLTCGNVAKGQRLETLSLTKEFKTQRGAHLESFTETGQYQILQGHVGALLPTLFAGHTGLIASTVVVFPKILRRLYDLSVATLEGDHEASGKARELQRQVTELEAIIARVSFSGIKYALHHYDDSSYGYLVRSPLPQVTEAQKKIVEVDLKPFWDLEQSL